ncbi:type II secretion system minor pseudopilin [Aquifex sp.]
MIIVVALIMFLTLSYYSADLMQETLSLKETYRKVYLKEKHALLLESILPRVIALLRKEDASYDALTDPWARPYVFDTPIGTVSVQITDEDRYINPNYLTKIKGLKDAFERLLRILEIDTSLLDKILVWSGQEEGYIDTEYPIKKNPLDSVYEIELFWKNKGDLYGKKRNLEEIPGLFKLITVFSDGKVNINTAPIYVLMSLDKDIDFELAKRIANYRKEKPFKKVNDILLVEGMNLDIAYRISPMVKVNSRFFKIKLSVDTEDVKTTLIAIYDRKNNTVVYKEIR